MLTQEENIRLSQTGKDTPMGQLLRRYWHPIAAASEFDAISTKRVRLLGEDLVLYKDLSGQYGLLGLHCAHRRADLSYGFVEESGLRCNYHGWLYDGAGRCTEQPFEDLQHVNHRFRDSIAQPAYPVQEMAGLLFAYLGPEPAPLLPYWELFDYKNGFAQIVFSDVACNWLQCAENNIDPVHNEWLHQNWNIRQAGHVRPYAPRHLEIGIDEWEYGFGYKRIYDNTDKDSDFWVHPRLHMMPNIFMPGGSHFEYRVPVDDTNTLSVVWHWSKVPAEREPYVQDVVPYWVAPITDPMTGRWITSHTINQDIVAWIGQGPLSDRENEHVARSDLGVVMFRRRLLSDLEAVARGEDPSGLCRDPSKNNPIRWPDNRRELITRSRPGAERGWRNLRPDRPNIRSAEDYFQFLAGQPEDVRRMYEEAMGL